MTSLSLPGLPSAFRLRMAFASWGELCASAREGSTAAVIPRADRSEANRIANVLRVEVKFIEMLLSKLSFNTESNGPGGRSGPAFRQPSSEAWPPFYCSGLTLAMTMEIAIDIQAQPRSLAPPPG